MNIIVMDLEWNQNPEARKEKNSDKPMFEIIEIGAVKLNENYEITDKFSKLIKPQLYHIMHKITTDLIHIQMKELKKEKYFPEIFKEFMDWCGEDIIFATWQLRINWESHPPPLSPVKKRKSAKRRLSSFLRRVS